VEPDPPELKRPVPSSVALAVGNGVARVTLDRPEAANAINLDLARDLLRVVNEIRDRDDVRVVLLRGAGARFCVGGDVKAFASQPDLPAHLRAVTEALHPAIAALVELDAPVVASVQGSAAGAGLGLVVAADLVVAAESATFVMAYTGIGLSPDGSTSYFLPRLVGHRRAIDLALTNRALDANEAHEWGIVTTVVPDAELTRATEQLVDALARGPTSAFGATKRLMRESWQHSLRPQLDLEIETIAAVAATRDAHEGLTSFVEKRMPEYDAT
jgi:2-(1,2-epoxy-1,2-dihydrophenyl)acetyl-CoA isomerase